MSDLLPEGYAALEIFVEDWAMPDCAARAQRRDESTYEERAVFFDAVKDRVASALNELDRKTPAEFNESEKRLLNLMLSFAHVALAIEVQGSAEAKHAEFRRELKIDNTTVDF